MVEVTLTPLTPKFYKFILRTRNESRENFVSQTIITDEDHKNYMDNFADGYYIGVVNGVSVGWVGVVKEDIRIYVEKIWRGQGIAERMLSILQGLHPDAKAKVKSNNTASIKLFEKSEFPYVVI